MTHHPRQVIMSFYDVPADRLEMVHQLFQHLSEVTQGSCNFNIVDPTVGDERLLPVYMADKYVGEASVDDEGDISMSIGRGATGLLLRQELMDGEIVGLNLQKQWNGVGDHA